MGITEPEARLSPQPSIASHRRHTRLSGTPHPSPEEDRASQISNTKGLALSVLAIRSRLGADIKISSLLFRTRDSQSWTHQAITQILHPPRFPPPERPQTTCPRSPDGQCIECRPDAQAPVPEPGPAALLLSSETVYHRGSSP